MVCKEELCTWFRDLQPHKRIDYMCGMLQMCLPMELRFMGSYVEDLAKKDFHELRESEGKANSHHELKKFSETDVRVFRTKMAVYLALLHSSNMSCSNIIFQLLENRVVDALTVSDSMDVMTVHNILLVLSMAMNHPAFSYHQKTRMYDHYKSAIQAAERIQVMNKVEQDLLLRVEPHEFRHCEQRISPMCSPHIPAVHLIPSRVAPHQANHLSNATYGEKVHVCHINVKGAQTRDAEKNTTEYKIQVTWSNGEKKNVFKTYQELMEFHKRLKQEFPDELLSHHQQTIQLPSIKAGTQNHRKENADLLSHYVTSLSKLPEHIRQSNYFVSFFESMLNRPEMADASTSPRSPTLIDVPVVQHLQNAEVEGNGVVDLQYPNQLQTPAMYPTYLSQSPLNGDMCSLSPHSPAHHELAYQDGLSPSFSTKTTSPLMSSSCHSPASSIESPSNSMPGSPSIRDREGTSLIQNCKEDNALLNCDENNLHNNESSLNPEEQSLLHTESNQDLAVTTLLKAHNFRHYADAFIGYSLEQVFSMRNEEIENFSGAPREIAAEIKHLVGEKMREKQPPRLNGPIEPIPHAGHMWHPCLHQQGTIPPIPYHHSIPSAYPQVFTYSFHDGGDVMPAGGQELSPSNSECSSPSPSPHLLHIATVRKQHLQPPQTDSSSDDGERDKRPGQYRSSSKWKGHVPPSDRNACPDKSSDMKFDTNSNSGTPPLIMDKSDSNNLYGNNGNSGYTSDPTFSRQQLMRGSYKAQPAHMNMQSQSKFLINMPENSFKGGAQSFVPMVRQQQLRDMTISSASNQQSYNTGGDFMGQRSMFLLPHNPHVFARGLFGQMNMSGTRPMFPPAAMTTGPGVNQTLMQPQPSPVNGGTQSVNCGKMFHGPPIPVNVDRKPTNLTMNGVESNANSQPQTSESCSQRSQTNSVNTVTSNSSSVTHTSGGITATTNRPASCSSCGCPGLSTHPQHPIPFMQHTMWPNPYSNSLLPVPAMPHPLYIHGHVPYPNGFNQDMIYGPQYGMQQAAPQGMSGAPNMMCGYNYNNQGAPTSVYNQKRPKKLNCHNCGSTKHIARDCTEVSMEAMSGQTIFRPKNDSD